MAQAVVDAKHQIAGRELDDDLEGKRNALVSSVAVNPDVIRKHIAQ
jgi:hypothetical protein